MRKLAVGTARAFLLVLVFVAAGCGWQRHTLTETARRVRVTSSEPSSCDMVGTFFTYSDCLSGMGVGNTDGEAQMECIRWKADRLGGNVALIDSTVGDGYYRGRVLRCGHSEL